MFTTFFGEQSFGGDAVYVERLSEALLRRGHSVDVVHNPDAFEALRDGLPARRYQPPPNLRLHPLKSPLGSASLVWTHQTGRLGLYARQLQRLFAENDYDVVHFHNSSLVGAPEAFRLGRPRVRLMTAHEWWLVCPLSSLWKFGEAVCTAPQCLRCALKAGRPPQLWRHTASLGQGLQQLDALLFPSRFALDLHRSRGIAARELVSLPYFLPDGWGGDTATTPPDRPYIACAGRLVKEKGFQNVIPLMEKLPGLDLRIAGAGPLEGDLRRLAQGLSNVHFLGLLNFPDLRHLYRHARALIVPSEFYETFGYVVLEAFATATPVIVNDCGPLPDLLRASNGGFIYREPEELLQAIASLAGDDGLRRQLGENGRAALQTIWSEQTHIDSYLSLIDRLASQRKNAS